MVGMWEFFGHNIHNLGKLCAQGTKGRVGGVM